MVITTPDVGVVVELKNWAGAVTLEGDRLIQRRPPPRPPVDHGPVFRDLEYKVKLLAAYHAEKGRPSVDLQPLVVFYNHRIRMPDALRARPDVTTFVQLQEELPRSDEGEPTPELRALRQTLDELGGWDVVTLHGGRALFGDVRGLPE